jgi:hypothetical protein
MLRGFFAFAVVVGLLAADRAFTPYASVKPILDAQGERLPHELRVQTRLGG